MQPNAPLAARRIVCKSIVLHLLAHKFDIAAEHVNYVADQFDVAYQVVKTPDEDEATNSEYLSLALVNSLDDLGKKLRALENIPLDISSVQGMATKYNKNDSIHQVYYCFVYIIAGTSAVFRYCGVQPITPVADSEWNGQTTEFKAFAINEFVIQLAASGKWPDNLAALQRLKAAFALRIAKELRDNDVVARSDGHVIDVLQSKVEQYFAICQTFKNCYLLQMGSFFEFESQSRRSWLL